MFRENKRHQQGQLLSTVNELRPAVRERLEKSWAGSFRREVFARLDEKPFAVLYADTGSRPNVAVNVLVGLEILKAGMGWTDEELYDEFMFNLQVRYALGYEDVTEGYFAIRTLYEFRRRLSEHMQATSENLLDAAFVQVTDAQVQAVQLRTEQVRMDSTQIASNIRQYSRLRLLVEVVRRVWRILHADDQAHYEASMAAYVKQQAGQYLYRLKPNEYAGQIQAVGALMAQLVTELAPTYAQAASYQRLQRVFQEHFVWNEQEQRTKAPSELASTSLQAPDDSEATFRRKAGQDYQGYVTNISESCHPDNPVQLILSVQTQPNVADDAHLLCSALPHLVARTHLTTLYTDGGYNCPALDPLLERYDVKHVQTALRGDKPDPHRLSLMDFQIECSPEGVPVAATCPQGQRFLIEAGRKPDHFIGRPQAATCNACPLLMRCPVRPRSTNRTPNLYFQRRTLQVAHKRQAIRQLDTHSNPRAAVEATIRSLKHPFRHGKLLVRGLFRVTCQLIASAMMVNARRLHRLSAPWCAPLAAALCASLFAHFGLLLCRFLAQPKRPGRPYPAIRSTQLTPFSTSRPQLDVRRLVFHPGQNAFLH